MIKSITLNPAVDKTIIVKDFKINSLNRVEKTFKDAGGKGVNVAKMINNLDGNIIATGFLGGCNGKFIKKEMDEMGIDHDFIKIKKETRTNIKMVDQINKTFADINEEGPFVAKKEILKLKEGIFSNLNPGDILTLSGSIPKGVNKNIYAELIQKASEKKIKTILDAEGEIFKKGIKKEPTLIKPNEHEMEKYFNTEFENLEEMITAAKTFLNEGIEMVMVSLGEQGALFLNSRKKIKINPLNLDIKSTVGAGDAMVAGLAFGLEKKMSVEEMIKLAAAASSATLVKSGTEMGKIEDVKKIIKKIEISYIDKKIDDALK